MRLVGERMVARGFARSQGCDRESAAGLLGPELALE